MRKGLFATEWKHSEFQGVPEAYCYGKGSYHAKGKLVLGTHWECPICGSLEALTDREKAYQDARDEMMLNGWSDPAIQLPKVDLTGSPFEEVA